jgi:hypothetical protein
VKQTPEQMALEIAVAIRSAVNERLEDLAALIGPRGHLTGAQLRTFKLEEPEPAPTLKVLAEMEELLNP